MIRVSTILFFLAPCAAAAERIEFNRHIRPLLSDHCFACHGPDKNARKADLRLDAREHAVAEIDGVRPIVPGKAAESEVFKRITASDPADIMPPPKVHKSLSPQQIELIRQWIDEGAEYQPHWSYVPVKRPEIPQVSVKTPVHNPIDSLVNKVLAAKGWSQSPEADPVTLVRRLHFDLIGLPPKPAVVADFKAGKLSYEQLVDQLLASKHYGERMAIGWLDIVRYADTVGYHGDQEVSVSPYRDYVIKSFNANKRFDVFTQEQLAGDLLPNATTEQKVGSGYNRLNMTTEEGGSQPQEFLVKYMTDRVRTTSTAWLGSTMGCAQCHDHKFDPLSMKDFYAMGAFFADIEEVGVYSGNGNRPPYLNVPREEDAAKLAALEAEISTTEAALRAPLPNMEETVRQWEAELKQKLASKHQSDFIWIDDDPPEATLSGKFNYVTKADGQVNTGVKARHQESSGMVQHFFNMAREPRTLGAGDVFYFDVFLDPQVRTRTVMLQVHSAENGGWEHRAFWGADKIAYGGIGADTPAHKPMGELPEFGKWVRLEVPAETLGFKPGDKVDGFSFDQFGGVVFWDQAGIKTNFENTLPPDVVAGLGVAPEERNEAQRKALEAYFRQTAREFAPLREKLAALESQKAALASGVKTLITVSTKPREIRILPRGNWMDDSGPVVQPAWPEIFGGKAPEDKRLTRLDLANWLVSKDNPLTARVFVNRLWKQFFGTGLSKQLDELGSQGEWPLHPELLDWLAAEFQDGWDVKKIVRLIVTSHTYRQSSAATPEQREADPEARWLARQQQIRLDAEIIRDTALAISGLLVDKIGGVSARPYQPAGYYAQLNFPTREYQPDSNENQWRRGIYTHWQRTFLHPMLLAFDAPSRDECAANRVVSNTPLQALVVLNDPTFVECAREFAARMMREGGAETTAKINFGLQAALSRDATPEEIAILQALLDKELKRFEADTKAADEALKVGLKPPPTDLPAPQLAAWTSVARGILNLHAVINRN